MTNLGDSNEYTQRTLILQMIIKIILICLLTYGDMIYS